jgi:transposase
MRQLEVRLKPWERRMLLSLRDRPPSPRVGRRATCLLLSAAGEPARQIARVTGMSLDAVTDVRRRWRDARGSRRRLRSLLDRPRIGRPAKVTAAYRRELRRALDKGPLSFGYLFTVWSIARLRTHLRKVTGITVSRDWLRRLAHREGFVVGRPKHTLRGKRNEAEYRRAKRRLERLKKGRVNRTRSSSCGTPTPASSNCCPTSCGAGCARANRSR